MKKAILLLTLVLCVCTSAYTQTKAAKNAFNTKFPDAENVKWGKENSKEYEAEFTLNGTDMSANFLKDGTWVETETSMGVDNLPQAVKDAVKSNYPNGRIVGASKIEKPNKDTIYETDIEIKSKTKEVVFDEKGNILK